MATTTGALPPLGRGVRRDIRWYSAAWRAARVALTAGVVAIVVTLLAGPLLGAPALAAPGVGVGAGAGAGAGGAGAGGHAKVIVMASPGFEAAAERAAVRVGGRVLRRLGVIDGFVVDVPASAVPGLRSLPGRGVGQPGPGDEADVDRPGSGV